MWKKKTILQKRNRCGNTPVGLCKARHCHCRLCGGLIFVLFKFDAVSKVGGVLFNAVSSFILGLFIAYILNVFLNLFENTVFGRLTRS